jgi:hypothetical protein
VRLGRKARLDDQRTLQFRRYLKVAKLPEPPTSVDYTQGISDWGVLRNNDLGDCTCAGLAHMFRIWDALTGGKERANDDDTVELYTRVTQPPFDPKTGANDDGAVELFVLREARKNGMRASGTDQGQDLMKLIAFAAVDVHNPVMVKLATYLFGGLYLGIDLPVTASRQQSVNQPWDDTGDQGPDGQPGGWGGHAVNVVGYDDANQMFSIVTWGKVQQMTYRFFARYVEEAWALIPDDYANLPQGKVLQGGFNYDQLMSDLKQFGTVNPDEIDAKKN